MAHSCSLEPSNNQSERCWWLEIRAAESLPRAWHYLKCFTCISCLRPEPQVAPASEMKPVKL